MTTHNFWKFASSVKDSEKLVDVFNKYAAAEKLSDFNAKYLWAAVNKDVENTLVKQAAETNSKIVSTAIKTVMESLPEVIQSVSNNEVDTMEEVKESTPEPKDENPKDEKSESESKPEAPSNDGSTGTVFDRLGE